MNNQQKKAMLSKMQKYYENKSLIGTNHWSNHFFCLNVCLSVCLTVSLTVCLSVCLSVSQSVCITVCLSVFSVCQSACLYLSVCLSVTLSVCLCVFQSVYIGISISFILSLCLCVSMSTCRSVCQSFCVSVCFSVSLSVSQSICLSVCLYVCLFVYCVYTRQYAFLSLFLSVCQTFQLFLQNCKMFFSSPRQALWSCCYSMHSQTVDAVLLLFRYNEVNNWDFTSGAKKAGAKGSTARFTQMVWEDSTKVWIHFAHYNDHNPEDSVAYTFFTSNQFISNQCSGPWKM